MSNINPIHNLEFDPNSGQYRYTTRLASWPLQQQQQRSPASLLSPPDMTSTRRSTSPTMPFESNNYHHAATYPPTTSVDATIMDTHQQQHQHHQQHHQQHQSQHHQQQQQQQQQWHMPAHPPLSYSIDTTFAQNPFSTYDTSFQASPAEYTPQHHPSLDSSTFDANLQASVTATMASAMNAGIPMDVYTTMALSTPISAGLHSGLGQLALPLSWSPEFPNFYDYDLSAMMAPAQQLAGSPIAGSETYSDRSWEYIEHPDHTNDAIFYPSQTLHPRSLSDSSSSSDNGPHSRNSLDGFVDVAHSMSSPSNDSAGDFAYSDQDYYHHHNDLTRNPSPTMPTGQPIMVPQPELFNTQNDSNGSTQQQQQQQTQQQRSPVSSAPRATDRPRKSTTGSRSGICGKGITKKTASASTTPPKEGEKKVGRRKGPLREDQRKQASEIRKLGACIRCRFLKKTCDPGNPCNGCQPAHARLWMVPCTRIDIKDLGYFVKDWKADYDRQICLAFTSANIKEMSEREETLYVTHGYGPVLCVNAREVYVRDDRVFGVDWVEADHNGVMSAHKVETAQLAIGKQGIQSAMISEYIDAHIDGDFEGYVDDFFMGSPFFPEILKVVHRYWLKERTPVIRKALKFVVAYNLTQAVCMMQPVGDRQENLPGAVPDDSQFRGRIAAPVMINFSVKCAMAEQWRALQQEVLQELSTLYTRVYSKDKLKHWPTIFMIASILLVVWEEMQFDCHYHVTDEQRVNKFCQEMVDTPIGVVIGLFSAISQKIPSFLEWDTPKHKESLNSEPSVCKAMEEVRDEIKRNEQYLKNRTNAQFDRNDFDSLSNMFVSKLVIRAH